jgi:hypothetical protein
MPTLNGQRNLQPALHQTPAAEKGSNIFPKFTPADSSTDSQLTVWLQVKNARKQKIFCMF